MLGVEQARPFIMMPHPAAVIQTLSRYCVLSPRKTLRPERRRCRLKACSTPRMRIPYLFYVCAVLRWASGAANLGLSGWACGPRIVTKTNPLTVQITPSVRSCEKLARQAKPPAPPSFQTLGQQGRWGRRFRVSSAGPPGSQFFTASQRGDGFAPTPSPSGCACGNDVAFAPTGRKRILVRDGGSADGSPLWTGVSTGFIGLRPG